MVIKKRKPIFLKVLSIVLVIALINIGYFVYSNVYSSKTITGFSINEINKSLSDRYNSLSFPLKIFLIGQWVFLLFILFYAAFRDRGLNAIIDENIGSKENIEIIEEIENIENAEIPAERNLDKTKTDLDVLYEILKNKKQLSISTISRLFKIDKDTALEWCKILESGELVSVSYPAFSEPFVLINEKEIKDITPEGSNISKNNINIKKEIKKSQSEPEDVVESQSEKNEIKESPSEPEDAVESQSEKNELKESQLWRVKTKDLTEEFKQKNKINRIKNR